MLQTNTQNVSEQTIYITNKRKNNSELIQDTIILLYKNQNKDFKQLNITDKNIHQHSTDTDMSL